MTPAQFIAWSEAYYGVNYNQVQKHETADYLKKFGETYIECLKEEVKYTISPRFKAVPGIADLEECREGALRRLQHINSKRRALQHNKVKQKAITDAREGNGEKDYRNQIVELFAKLKKRVHVETREEA